MAVSCGILHEGGSFTGVPTFNVKIDNAKDMKPWHMEVKRDDKWRVQFLYDMEDGDDRAQALGATHVYVGGVRMLKTLDSEKEAWDYCVSQCTLLHEKSSKCDIKKVCAKSHLHIFSKNSVQVLSLHPDANWVGEDSQGRLCRDTGESLLMRISRGYRTFINENGKEKYDKIAKDELNRLKSKTDDKKTDKTNDKMSDE